MQGIHKYFLAIWAAQYLISIRGAHISLDPLHLPILRRASLLAGRVHVCVSVCARCVYVCLGRALPWRCLAPRV